VQLVAGAGVVLEVAHQCQRIGLGLLGGFAAVALLDGRKFVGVLGHLGGELHQQSPALGGADLAPDGIKHWRAACTAASMSCALLRWISSKTCPSDGSITGIVRPDEEGVEALAM
jgi:hypothetical protein